MLTVRCVDRPEEFAALKSAWDDLLSRDPRADLLLAHEWFMMSWTTYCRQHELFLLVVEEGPRVVGIVPLMIRAEKRHGVAVRRLTFLHEGSSYYRGEFLIPERTEEILDAVFEFLSHTTGQWDLAAFAGIRDDSPTVEVLGPIAARHGMAIEGWRPFGEALGMSVKATGSWEDFLQRQGRHFRKNTRRAENRLRDMGTVNFLTARDPESVQEGIRHLYRIQRKNRLAGGEAIPESDSASESAALALAEACSAHKVPEVQILHLNGEPIAGLFSIVYRECLYAVIIKHDKAYAAISPGWLILFYAMQDAWRRDLARVDFLMRWPYVERWTSEVTRYLQVDCFHRRPLSRGLRYAKRYVTPLVHSSVGFARSLVTRESHAPPADA